MSKCTFSSSPSGRDFVAELSNQPAPLETHPASERQQSQPQHQTQVQIERDDAIETDSLLSLIHI